MLLALWSASAWAQLMTSPWPMFRHDISHSGVSPYHDPTPGDTVWSLNVGNGLSSPVIASDGTIFIGGSSGTLKAVNPDGTLKWSQTISATTRSTPAIGSDGTVYIGSSGRLYAYTSAGVYKWSYALSGDVTSSPIIGSDNTVYIGSRGGYLYALTPGTTSATLKWYRSVGDMHMTSPILSADGATIYTGGGFSLYAINTSNGTVKWTYSIGVSMTSSAALSPDGSTIYIGAYDGNLYSVKASDGTLNWQAQVGFKNAATSASPAVGPDGTIYLGSNYGTLYAINPDGTQKWQVESKADTAGDRDIRSSVAINADGTVILASYDGYVRGLDSATGAEKWHYLLPGKNFASPAIASDGSVITATMSGILYGNIKTTPSTANPPSDLVVTASSATAISLSWTDNSTDEYGFRIERRVGTVGPYSYLSTTTGSTYTDTTGLQSGMTYCYRVCAYQQGGFSAYSNEVQVDTPGLMTPTGLTAMVINEHQVDLAWTDRASDELGFVIERMEGPNGLFQTVGVVGQNVQNYSDTSTYSAKNYYYRIRAYDATRFSSYSNEAWALTPGKDFGEVLTGDPNRKQIALTFDAGTAAIRSSLLSTLKSNNVFCSFFITGYVCETQKSLVAQIARDGHIIGNHSYDHPDLRFVSPDQLAWQFSTTDAIIYGASGQHTRSWFRAPYGAKDDNLLANAAAIGFRHVNWTADSGDAGGNSTQGIINSALAGAKNGAIILFHCTIGNTEAAMQTIITQLRGQGYELVTVPELVAPKQVVSPDNALRPGWNLISIPIEPALPFPHIVFRNVPIDRALFRWDSQAGSKGLYDATAASSFGNISPDEGYWLWLDNPATIKCNGSAITEDRHIKLPMPDANNFSNWATFGYPFESPQELSNCKVYNPNAPDPKTRPIKEAMDLGWIPNCFFAWDPASQSQYDVSVPDYFPNSTQLDPWHGYLGLAFAPGVELIIPKP